MKSLFTFCLLAMSSVLFAQDAPEKVVQIQLDAYNRGDLKAFVATYADSVEIFGFKNPNAWTRGKEQLEKSYGELFKAFPKNYAALRGRIVQGDFVIDKEFVTGRDGRKDFEGTAIYEVKNGLIVKVWFLP